MTITTVGYGDISPRTELGQLVASLAMIIGVIIGTYSSIFVATPILNYSKVNQKSVMKTDEKNN